MSMSTASCAVGVDAIGTLGPDIGGWLTVVRPWRRADGTMTDADGTEWISADTAAEIAGVDSSSIWKAAVKRGEIACRKEGRNWRYRRDDVERWAEDRRKVLDRLADHDKLLAEHSKKLAENDRILAELRARLSEDER